MFCFWGHQNQFKDSYITCLSRSISILDLIWLNVASAMCGQSRVKMQREAFRDPCLR